MSIQKGKALLICCAMLLFTGCGQPLSNREIVRAVFFMHQRGQYSVCLLMADQNAAENDLQYKTASAQGSTVAQALHRAENTLSGDMYYGLLDLAVLPPGCDWQTSQEVGTLLYDKAQPAPELSVFVLDSADYNWDENAAALYEDMTAVESMYQLHCGLQQLFTQADNCTVPGYRPDTGYDFYLLAKNQSSRHLSGLSAQLAAVISGQAKCIAASYNDGQAFCRTLASVTVSDTTVQLHLKNTNFQALTDANTDLQAAFCNALQQSFSILYENQTADFFHLRFWHSNLYGPFSTPSDPQLEIYFE